MKRHCPTCNQPWAYMDARAALRIPGPLPGTRKGIKTGGRKPRPRYQPTEEQARQPAEAVVTSHTQKAPVAPETSTTPKGEN